MTRLVCIVWLSMAAMLPAQTPAGSLTGKLTDTSGAAVTNVTVTATNAANGQVKTATSGADGVYRIDGLAPGTYSVKFAALGFEPVEMPPATVTASAPLQMDVKLVPMAQTPSLGDLGFSPQQTQGNPQEQARLNKRAHMLKIHQRLGLITIAPLVATLFASNGAAGHNSTSSGRELHAVLGGVTAGLYLTTASFAVFAPKIHDVPARGPVRVHRALAWIHGPGMILTPILGAMAYDQKNRGEKVHGIASAHGAVAGVTAAAFGAAILSVTIKF